MDSARSRHEREMSRAMVRLKNGDPPKDGSGAQLSSRLFVKGLPRGITEADFRNHFSAKGREITDIKLIPKRGIGFVGYRTPEEAEKAVKYFHRSYIRMSKLAVELARPMADPSADEPVKGRNELPKPVVAELNPKKRKRDDLDASDPRLREFLQVMQPSRTQGKDIPEDQFANNEIPEGESDGEYELIQAHKRKQRAEGQQAEKPYGSAVVGRPETSASTEKPAERPTSPAAEPSETIAPAHAAGADATDDEWLRSRTSRVLDLMDVDDLQPPPQRTEDEAVETEPTADSLAENSNDEVGADEKRTSSELLDIDSAVQTIQQTSRLYVRNLPYQATEEDVAERFEKFGELEKVHVPVDGSGASKGFAFVHYANPSAAVEALQSLDGTTFQGRLLHVLPGEAPKHQGLDEFAISKLPLKKQNQIRKKTEAAKSAFSWNSLYMSQDAVKASVASRLGISKADLIDHTSSEAAVKQAIAETSVIQEARAYFAANGVDIDAFKSRKRGDAAILVKNFPHGTKIEEIRTMFEEHGTVLQVLMPPGGTIAIVQFANPAQGKMAFDKLAYCRFKSSILFLEKGPQDLFGKRSEGDVQVDGDRPTGIQKLSVTELLEHDDEDESPAEKTSLFVKNLNFETTTDGLAEVFKSLDGFISAVVKTKTDQKRPGQVLSMGFGFVEFRTKEQAQAALRTMDNYVLDGHAMSVKVSHKGHDAAEERRRKDTARKVAGQQTKIIIKNLPFEASKKDVRALFGTYGQLRAVRVPKKFGNSSRGFAFAEFVTAREAENALNAMKDTHLLGRRLVLDYAQAEAVDPEEEIAKMQKKIGGQVNKVTLQQLTGRGRQKVNIGDEKEDELDA